MYSSHRLAEVEAQLSSLQGSVQEGVVGLQGSITGLAHRWVLQSSKGYLYKFFSLYYHYFPNPFWYYNSVKILPSTPSLRLTGLEDQAGRGRSGQACVATRSTYTLL